MHVIHHIIFLCLFCFLLSYGDYRDLHVLTHSFPTLCSSDLQIAYFHEAAALGELFNGIAPMQQYALITINIGQAGFATCGRSKARIKGEHARVCVKLPRSEEHTSELQSLMRISYAVFCLKKKNKNKVTKIQRLSQYIHEKPKNTQ